MKGYQFSLRHLLAGIAVVGIGAALWVAASNEMPVAARSALSQIWSLSMRLRTELASDSDLLAGLQNGDNLQLGNFFSNCATPASVNPLKLMPSTNFKSLFFERWSNPASLIATCFI